jgi:hypothetical protein
MANDGSPVAYALRFEGRHLGRRVRSSMRNIIALLGAVAMTTAIAIADVAQTPGSKITVSQCTLKLPSDPAVTTGVNAQGQPTTSESVTLGSTGSSSIRIGYTNDADVAAAEIDFALVGRTGTMTSVKDVGKLGAGAVIQHDFKIHLDSFPLNPGATKCIVTKVVYADGTAWVNPSPPQ